jgi:hypothetical protein
MGDNRISKAPHRHDVAAFQEQLEKAVETVVAEHDGAEVVVIARAPCGCFVSSVSGTNGIELAREFVADAEKLS